MARILYVATSDIHLKTFHVPYLRWLQEHGHTVDIVAERRSEYSFENARRHFDVKMPRALGVSNLRTCLRQLTEIVEDGDYNLIHCHTPIPSALIRIAARNMRQHGLKVLYTAHGFHFYPGGPVSSWLTYFPVELLLSRWTDGIVTINRTDYRYASRFMRAKSNYLIPGIGFDSKRFRPRSISDRQRIRSKCGFGEDDLLILYIAEFIPRKNHAFVVIAAETLVRAIPNVKLIFLGTGELAGYIEDEVRNREMAEYVRCLGFREDVEDFAAIADIGISASRHEGLGLGLAEQMACGVPVVASEDKGHRELVDDGVNGFIYPQNNTGEFCRRVIQLASDKDLRETLGSAALRKSQKFAIKESLAVMSKIYGEFLP